MVCNVFNIYYMKCLDSYTFHIINIKYIAHHWPLQVIKQTIAQLSPNTNYNKLKFNCAQLRVAICLDLLVICLLINLLQQD
jgi:hypothetical protein